MDDKNQTFHYTYSAAQQAEIRAIRKKYTAPEEQEDKMARLRRLDRQAGRKAQARSLTVGILGALLLGTGMSLAMTELGELLGAYAMAVGIPVGLLGMALAGLAYPVYSRVLKRERRRIAPEILRLTEELMK